MTGALIAKRARAMRRALTEPEAMLWSRLKGRGQGRPVFRRQVVFEKMIFDFYCVAARLAVEVDGSTHWTDETLAQDQARDAWLRRQGVEVLRIPAAEIYRNLNAAADAVTQRAVFLSREAGEGDHRP